jgi:COPII coat assembly protein SEC16
MTKPSLDSIGTWLEGRFTKLITGDSSPLPTEHAIPREDRTFSGPFAHYNTISSATSSASASPQPSTINLNVLPPPRRTGSAMAYPLPTNSHVPIDRASSAMDYIRRKPSPSPRIASANAMTTSFGQVSPLKPTNDYSPNGGFETMTPRAIPNNNERQGDSQEPAWWGSSYVDSNGQTPKAASFMRVDEPKSTSSSGFISLMDDASFSVASANNGRAQENHIDEDVEDLGFGNSSNRDKVPKEVNNEGSNNEGTNDEGSKTPPATAKAEPPKAAAAPGTFNSVRHLRV